MGSDGSDNTGRQPADNDDIIITSVNNDMISSTTSADRTASNESDKPLTVQLSTSLAPLDSDNDASSSLPPTPPATGASRSELTQEQARSWHFGMLNREIAQMGEDFVAQHMTDVSLVNTFRAAAICARYTDEPNPQTAIDATLIAGEVLSLEEKTMLREELTNRWRQPKKMYLVAIICSLSAAVMGMDETVVNGAMAFFKGQFGIGSTDLLTTTKLGAVCAAPYICCALFACWMTQPLNRRFGRRGTIVIVSILSLLGCVFSALTHSAVQLGLARAFLGLGIGPNSATTPMFAAECSPPRIRGALVMQWQVWTAFGIMLGYASSMMFFQVQDPVGPTAFPGTNWRIMLASAGLPALILVMFHWAVPESPRWFLTKGKYDAAWHAMKQLRRCELQAARDLFQAHQGILAERRLQDADPRRGSTWFQARSMFSERRNRRAFFASEICMFLQQFSGVNIVAYYSSEIFIEAKMPHMIALGTSLGFGAINFIFALPAFFTIDRLGRRPLLLYTVPCMVIFLLATAGSFWAPEGTTRIASIATSIYLFGVSYSSGAGPVPFTYSAEAYPLHIRPLGMSCATATAWFFNATLALTWPPLMHAITPQGAFGFYAAANVAAWFLVLFFVPETKNKTLEELDQVFDVPASKMIKDGRNEFGRGIQSLFACFAGRKPAADTAIAMTDTTTATTATTDGKPNKSMAKETVLPRGFQDA